MLFRTDPVVAPRPHQAAALALVTSAVRLRGPQEGTQCLASRLQSLNLLYGLVQGPRGPSARPSSRAAASSCAFATPVIPWLGPKTCLGGPESNVLRTETAVPAFKIYYVEPGGLVPAGWSPVRVTLCVCESAHACVYPCGVVMWKTFETYLRVASVSIG